jgi:LEA14-like dessication related protein
MPSPFFFLSSQFWQDGLWRISPQVSHEVPGSSSLREGDYNFFPCNSSYHLFRLGAMVMMPCELSIEDHSISLTRKSVAWCLLKLMEKNMPILKKAVPLFFLLFLLGCAAVKELIQPPKVDFESVKLVNFSFDQVTMDFALSIYNPNPIGASLAGYDYAFAIEGNSFLKGDESPSLVLPASGSGTLHIPVTVRFKELYNLFKTTEKQDTVGYQISGHVRPGGILTGLNIPFSKSGNLPALKVPKVSLSGLKMKGLSFSKIDLELGVNVDNPNIFGFDMSKLDYRLNIEGQEVASGITDQVGQVPKKGKGTVTLPISLSFSGVASTLRSALTGQAVDCVVTGATTLNTQYGQVDLPINVSQNVKIFR